MNNEIEVEFKKGLLFIDVKVKITIVNFILILMKIYKIQIINKFRYIAVKFNEEKINKLLLWFLKLSVLNVNGDLMILGNKRYSKSVFKKYYVTNNIEHAFDIFSIIV